jgi:hypothetical protein
MILWNVSEWWHIYNDLKHCCIKVYHTVDKHYEFYIARFGQVDRQRSSIHMVMLLSTTVISTTRAHDKFRRGSLFDHVRSDMVNFWVVSWNGRSAPPYPVCRVWPSNEKGWSLVSWFAVVLRNGILCEFLLRNQDTWLITSLFYVACERGACNVARHESACESHVAIV